MKKQHYRIFQDMVVASCIGGKNDLCVRMSHKSVFWGYLWWRRLMLLTLPFSPPPLWCHMAWFSTLIFIVVFLFSLLFCFPRNRICAPILDTYYLLSANIFDNFFFLIKIVFLCFEVFGNVPSTLTNFVRATNKWNYYQFCVSRHELLVLRADPFFEVGF